MAFNFSPKVVTEGLVLYLDAANTKSYVSGSTTWNDISRTGANGTLINGPTFNSGNGGSIVFDGVDDYCNLPSSLPRLYGTFTISLWVNPARISIPTTSQSLITTDWSVGFLNYMIYQTNDKFNTVIGNGTSSDPIMTSNTTLIANTWYNLVLVCNGTSHIMYINGNSDVIQNGAYSGVLTSNVRNLATDNVGSVGYFFQGNISNTLWYNRALTAQEIQQNYNATRTRYGL